ncbi:hypothetical protein SLEP1_g58143 [Rubroshorea leprosula]|uniref:Uncharacterized protein n=1 Tax=Rubroshorea leprosula TaxID=152421 RepID=A0AAV5MPL6_9ROSI|nr:hypothetical protein SLEP1_g58143 [Rubroshorea leprosula]
MAHQGDDSGADRSFGGGGDLGDAPSLEHGTVSPLLPPQSGKSACIFTARSCLDFPFLT